MSTDVCVNELLTELSREHKIKIPGLEDISRRTELIGRLVQRVREDCTEARLRSFSPDRLEQECARLQRISELMLKRLKVIKGMIADQASGSAE